MDLTAAIQEHFEGTFPGLLGIELSEVSPQRVIGVFQYNPICVRLGNTHTEGR